MESLQSDLQKYRSELQSFILKEHASLCPPHMRQIFVSSNELGESLDWKINAVKDKGLSLDTLRDLKILVERRKELYT